MIARFVRAGTLLVAMLVAGCAAPSGPISLSLSELGSEVQEDAGSLFQGIRHRRSHNITGLGSSEMVGMLSADPDPPLLFRWPSLFTRRNLPDQLSPRINSACSRVAVHDLPMAAGKGMDQVLELRDSLDALHVAEVGVQRGRALALLLDEIVASLADAPAAGAAASAPGPADRRVQRQALVVDAWRRLEPGGKVPDDVEGWIARQAAQAASLARLQAALDAAQARFRSARKEQGVIVARWEYEASRQGGLAAVGLNAEGRETGTRSGFVVMGHPRTLTLISGDDLMARACGAEEAQCKGGIAAGTRTGIDTMIPARRLYTTTFQLLARHLAWAESGAADQQFALQLQLTELARTAGASGLESLKSRLEALNVDLGYASRTTTSGENLGAVSGAVHWEVPFTFWRDDAYARSVAYLRAMNGDFLRVSSMRTTLDAYASRYGGTLPKPSADACENKGPSREDVARATKVHLACDRLDQPEFVRTLEPGDLQRRRERCTELGAPRPSVQTAELGAAG